ncbi:TPA: hypothetical protein N0F65_006883 [Lagenidium giganteum]|uniref:C2H2-type domain-containing protein n=1 Tax=Lagenidium giganteum TaxID=4803 RepID=A0AAV2ZFI2_9STRA|nr:TPA: hypothetical protein N0F65_006883 [Lagenidium giganteum]
MADEQQMQQAAAAGSKTDVGMGPEWPRSIASPAHPGAELHATSARALVDADNSRQRATPSSSPSSSHEDMQDYDSPPRGALPALWDNTVGAHDDAGAMHQHQEHADAEADDQAMDAHSGGEMREKPNKRNVFVCSECDKRFPRSFALRRHLRIHTGTKPYACDHEGCTQRFNTSGNLSRHKRIHSGERPYPCIFATCGKRFNTSTKLKRHMRIHFPEGEHLFRCIGLDCTWSCDNYKEFVHHQKTHHSIHIDGPTSIDSTKSEARLGENDGRYANFDSAMAHEGHYHHDAAGASDPATRAFYGTSYQPVRHHDYPDQHGHGMSSAFVYNYADKTKSFGSSLLPPPPQSSALPSSRDMPLGLYSGSSGALTSMLSKETKKAHDMNHAYADAGRYKTQYAAMPTHSTFSAPQHQHHKMSYDHQSAAFSDSPVGPPTSAPATSYRFPSYTTSSWASSSSYFLPPHHHAQSQSSFSRSDSDTYEQQPSHAAQGSGHFTQQQVLRPPRTERDPSAKYGNFAVPPPMNPAAPEFTGEELNVVLELMKDSY